MRESLYQLALPLPSYVSLPVSARGEARQMSTDSKRMVDGLGARKDRTSIEQMGTAAGSARVGSRSQQYTSTAYACPSFGVGGSSGDAHKVPPSGIHDVNTPSALSLKTDLLLLLGLGVSGGVICDGVAVVWCAPQGC
jgi:hypothetical protein